VKKIMPQGLKPLVFMRAVRAKPEGLAYLEADASAYLKVGVSAYLEAGGLRDR
jgi:hypothetical protein